MSNFDQIVELIADDLSAIEAKLTEHTASEYTFVDMAVQHVVEGWRETAPSDSRCAFCQSL